MVCIYCSGKTTVSNSRAQKRLGQTWRRRECTICGAVFSTIEYPDLYTGLRVRLPDGRLEPFTRDKLYLSIVTALGHRSDAVEAATALTATVISKVVKTVQEACTTREAICSITADTLEAFDHTGVVLYRAYHD